MLCVMKPYLFVGTELEAFKCIIRCMTVLRIGSVMLDISRQRGSFVLLWSVHRLLACSLRCILTATAFATCNRRIYSTSLGQQDLKQLSSPLNFAVQFKLQLFYIAKTTAFSTLKHWQELKPYDSCSSEPQQTAYTEITKELRRICQAFCGQLPPFKLRGMVPFDQNRENLQGAKCSSLRFCSIHAELYMSRTRSSRPILFIIFDCLLNSLPQKFV